MEDEYYRRSKSRERRRSRSYERYASHSRSEAKDKHRGKFPFLILVNEQFLHLYSDQFCKKVAEDTDCSEISFESGLQIPDIKGKVIKIQAKSLKSRKRAAKIVVEEMMAELRKMPGDSITILVFIPEGMVSLIIGAKGRQIKLLTQDSKTDIVVNQPIHRMSHRTVKIDGEPSNIAQAIAMIYGLLEERAEDFKDITEPVKPFNIATVKMKALFVIDHKVVGFVIGRNGQFTRYCLDSYDVKLKIVDQRRFHKVIRNYEDVAILEGRLRDVQKCSSLLIEKVHDYFSNMSRSNYAASENTQLLIPAYLVTKIIGAKGCMIREIASRSGGTQIKILSNKSAEKDSQEIVVSIAGNLSGKQEAANLILEQIELFKNGGPVLTTGSCLNDNIATQYKHSVQGRDSSTTKAVKERRRSRGSSSDSSRRQRSRSSSLEERYTRKRDNEVNKMPENKNVIIHPKEVNLIRAQLNSEFLNKPVPFPPAFATIPNSNTAKNYSVPVPLAKKPSNIEESKLEESKISEVPPKRLEQVKEKPVPIKPEKKKEEEVRMKEANAPKASPKPKEVPVAPAPTPPPKPSSNFHSPSEMASILDMEITKFKPFKLTLLFESFSEAIRFENYIELHNKNNKSKVEFSTESLGSRGKSFTLKSSPSTIAEIIKEHGTKETN